MPTVPEGVRGRPATAAPRLHGWLHPAVLAAAALSVASGFAQFAVITGLADVAREFSDEPVPADELALSGTAIGVGLAVIRAAALGGLPLAALADRLGRKAVVLAVTVAGLALTAVAALAPAYVVLVALLAAARPLLSATNAVAGVIAAEETRAADRSRAIALVTAAYGTGAGTTTVVRAVWGHALGARGLFALCAGALLVLPLIARLLEEPDRFARLQALGQRAHLALGSVHRQVRGRLALLCLLTFSATFAATPVTSFVFAYAETALGLPRRLQPLVAVPAAAGALLGLVAGIWAADRLGRRPTSALLHVVAGLGGVATYAAAVPLAIGGYVTVLAAGSAYAPAVGAMSAEIFPTADRATAAGWLTAASAAGAVSGLIAFGVLVDAFDGWLGPALLVNLPMMATSALYLRLPETRGMELEESAPDLP